MEILAIVKDLEEESKERHGNSSRGEIERKKVPWKRGFDPTLRISSLGNQDGRASMLDHVFKSTQFKERCWIFKGRPSIGFCTIS